MLDDLERTARLLSRLEAALPIPTMVSQAVKGELHDHPAAAHFAARCMITSLHYVGDPGGIMCRLAFGAAGDMDPLIVSITHLRFDPRLPFARDIAVYQKHRMKLIRREERLYSYA